MFKLIFEHFFILNYIKFNYIAFLCCCLAFSSAFLEAYHFSEISSNCFSYFLLLFTNNTFVGLYDGFRVYVVTRAHLVHKHTLVAGVLQIPQKRRPVDAALSLNPVAFIQTVVIGSVDGRNPLPDIAEEGVVVLDEEVVGVETNHHFGMLRNHIQDFVRGTAQTGPGQVLQTEHRTNPGCTLLEDSYAFHCIVQPFLSLRFLNGFAAWVEHQAFRFEHSGPLYHQSLLCHTFRALVLVTQ